MPNDLNNSDSTVVQEEADAEKLKRLHLERDVIISKLTRFINFMQVANEINLVELESRLEHVPSIAHQFDVIQSQIEALDNGEITGESRETFENSYFKTVATARATIMQLHRNINARVQASNATSVANTSTQPSTGRFCLPPIDLPKYDGDYKKWLFFSQRFLALVDSNTQLSQMEKFYYLQGRLQGEALEVIQDIELTDDNYAVALKLLTDRYENKRVIVDRHVEDLFNLPEVHSESATHLRKLIDSVKHLRSLKALGEPTDSWDRLVIHLIKSKLDKTTRDRWQEVSHTQAQKTPPTVSEILNFLVCRCEYLESLDKDKGSQSFKKNIKFAQNSRITQSFSTVNNKTIQANESYQISCFHCNQNHPIYNCTKFIQLSLEDKYKELKRLGICSNCLKRGHTKFQCKSSSCRVCRARHNSMLHPPDTPAHILNTVNNQNHSQPPNSVAQVQSSPTPSTSYTSISAHSLDNNLTLLSTAIVHIQDKFGHLHSARALLDVGSQSNYITSSLAKKLQLDETNVNISVSGVGQKSIAVFNQALATVKSAHSDFQIELPFLILSHITDKIPNSFFNLNHLNIPRNILLADPTLNNPNDIDLLLGASHFYELLNNHQISLGKGKPLLQSTKLGWILAGVINLPCQSKPQKTFCALTLNQQLTKFWELEETPAKKHFSLEETFCETVFKETTTRDTDGKFIVKFPLNESINQLGDSKPTALKRLHSVEKRFERDSEYKTLYTNFINEYLTLNHMSLISSNVEDPTFAFYLPHHGVKKDTSSTTKLRVVYDGSAVTDSGISLNHCLSVGPQLQDDLFDIIIRFRSHPYILTADIEKMYRMVVIHPEHRRFQRIFWRDDTNKPIQIFELSRLAYGLAPASYLATRCLQELAHENMSLYPKACNVILRDFFVDDLLTGVDSIPEAIQLKQEITYILQSGGFELRKWASNHVEIISDQSSEHQTFYQKSDLKTLGLIWDPSLDVLQYSVDFQLVQETQITKRKILSTISKIFDPLGLVGPTTIKAKILMQRLWQCQSKWDDPVPFNLLEIWKSFINQIHLINNLVIPRHSLCTSPDRIEIHGFCDSSEAAYGCCIYIRSFNSTEQTVRLLCAKSRVAPLKKITLPRLELCGALILSRLLKSIRSSLTLKIDQTFLYTDSKIVLAWIATQPCYLQTFVANRIADITENTSVNDWYHVNSNDNPADIISRGTKPEQLISSDLWWNGPKFLHESNIEISHNIDLTDIEIPDKKVISTTLINQTSTNFSIFDKFSSFSKLIRVTAFILRFKNNCLSQSKQGGPLLTTELNSALLVLIKLVQQNEFATEILYLSKNKTLPKTSKLLNLNPFLDKNQVLRVGGRIQQSNVRFDQKHPIVLPKKHKFTELLIHKEHITHLHASTQLLLSVIRLRFWPLSGKSAVKRVLRRCVQCSKAKPVPLTQLMGNLPADRFVTFRPFFKTAVDYAGPFSTKISRIRNSKLVKSYICVFVCLATKATHLELVHDLSADAFFNALKRFICRRGKPSDIYSDNGTNFVGCNNELRDLYKFLTSKSQKTKIHDFLARDNINWHFIPANSPHMGGLWEAAVKAAKYHLRRVMFNDHLTFDEMYTLLVQIEACLNSRPLTQLSNDPSDFSPLTPAHFLIGDSLAAVPEPNLLEIPQTRLNRHKRLQQIQQHFWSRWSKEYLSQLQVRSKWYTYHPDSIKEGSLVIIKEDGVPPLQWRMGRIIELFPGPDNIVRVVKVRVPSGAIYTRSIAKLCLLPAE